MLDNISTKYVGLFCFIELKKILFSRHQITTPNNHVYFRISKNKDIANASSRSFLRILKISIGGLFNFDHKQWRVRGSG